MRNRRLSSRRVQPPLTRPPAATAVAVVVVVAIAALLSGCGALLIKPNVKVDAEYRGLAGKHVAVIVAATDKTLFAYPGAPLNVCRAVSNRLVTQIKGVTVVDPAAIDQFQQKNPYWNTIPYGDLIKKLNVQRLVYIDLAQYATHEPGNAHVWQGVVLANVGVIEAEATDPNNFTYFSNLQTIYPPDRPVGLLQSDDKTIQLGMLTLFAEQVANRFADHEVKGK